jgi:CubicO group peptidase (beta-lactamase class C family)
MMNIMQLHTPESTGISTKRLERLHTGMQSYVDSSRVTGLSTLLYRHGKTVDYFSCGMANIEANLPIAEDTLFRIYSMTKPITAAAVLMLLEEGKLRLTDPASRFVPAFRNLMVAENPRDGKTKLIKPVREITIRDLLTHTSGLTYGLYGTDWVDEQYKKVLWPAVEANQNLPIAEFVDIALTLPLVFQPGTDFRYSISLDVLGLIIQIISGMPFGEFLQQRIFKPLGMKDTAFYVPQEKAGRFASTYSPDINGGLRCSDPATGSKFLNPNRYQAGGGGLVSTMGDYLQFARMLLGEGEVDGNRLLGRKTIEMMRANHLPTGILPFGQPGYGYGLGVGVYVDPVKGGVLGSPGHFGWSGAAGTYFWVDPLEDLICILMTQITPPPPQLSEDLRTLVYQSLLA